MSPMMRTVMPTVVYIVDGDIIVTMAGRVDGAEMACKRSSIEQLEIMIQLN